MGEGTLMKVVFFFLFLDLQESVRITKYVFSICIRCEWDAANAQASVILCSLLRTRSMQTQPFRKHLAARQGVYLGGGIDAMSL